MERRRTKAALKEAKLLMRVSYAGYLAFIPYYTAVSLLAPWPKLTHISSSLSPYWELKLGLGVFIFMAGMSFYHWFVRYGWKTEQLIWWKWIGYVLMSLPAMLIVLLCAVQRQQSYLLATLLLCGWVGVFLYFFLRRFMRWDRFYQLMLDRKIVVETGEYYPEVWLPSMSELKGGPKPKINLAPAASSGVIVALGVTLSGPLFNVMGSDAEGMNIFWLAGHYLLACLTAPIPATMIFELLCIYRWKRENGSMPLLAKLVKVPKVKQ